MSSKIFLSSAAENDIDEIITYLAPENPKAAYTFLDSLDDAIEQNARAISPSLEAGQASTIFLPAIALDCFTRIDF